MLSTRRAPNIRVLRCQRGQREFCFSHSKSGGLQLIRACRLNYLWTNPGGRQVSLPAPTYIDYVMTSIQNLIDDENVFPTKASTFPRHVRSSASSQHKSLWQISRFTPPSPPRSARCTGNSCGCLRTSITRTISRFCTSAPSRISTRSLPTS